MLSIAVPLLVLVASGSSTSTCDSNDTDKCVNVSGTPSTTFNQDTDWQKATSIYQFTAKDINGQDVSLEKYRGHVLIVVNVASSCGLTDNNYRQLQAIYEKYRDSKGLRILAFPSNQFAGQEPGTSSQIVDFVKQYNVQFDMFEKVNVNGEDAHPLWKWLKTKGSGFITNDIKWNFTKFIIDKQGQVVQRYAPTTAPTSFEGELQTYF